MIDPKLPNNAIQFALPTMSEEDRVAGSIFTPLQAQCIKVELVKLAQELVDLVPPVTEGGYSKYIQEHARLKGASEHLLHLLDKSDAAAAEYAIPSPIAPNQ